MKLVSPNGQTQDVPVTLAGLSPTVQAAALERLRDELVTQYPGIVASLSDPTLLAECETQLGTQETLDIIGECANVATAS